ncbi:hypothetical protein ACFV2N_45655 [Streptomyces sp. NPDC059680]|uniref:hypothetical protein n=1 Tax=Streptomyces sp. NPDC059680 TaxID=3346904 RepID=UPI003687899D
MNGKVLLIPLVSMALVSLAAAPSSAAEHGGRSLPKAQAFDGDKPLPSISEVTNLCSQGEGCRFLIDSVQEYRGGVISVGNSFLNCSDHDITVHRTISLTPSVTDNIGGQISGKSNETGTITNTAQVQHTGTAQGTETIQNTVQTWEPDISKATSSQIGQNTTQGQLTGAIQDQLTGSQSAQQAFETSAGRNYGRTWQNTIQNSTTVDATAPAGDVLDLGYMDVGQRVSGTLKALGTSKYVKNVVVDEPSIMESSSFVAQNYTAPRGSCRDIRPTMRSVAVPSPQRRMEPKTRGVLRARRK